MEYISAKSQAKAEFTFKSLIKNKSYKSLRKTALGKHLNAVFSCQCFFLKTLNAQVQKLGQQPFIHTNY
mgnify:CR=1 FL=1